MTQPETTLNGTPVEPQPKTDEALEGKPVEAVKGEVKKEEGTPTEGETYTKEAWEKREEELGKRISGLDTKLTQTLKDSRESTSTLEKALEAAQLATEDAKDTTFLKKVEEEGGDVSAAKGMLAREKAVRVSEREQAKTAKEQGAQSAILAEAGKAKKATDLIKEHELDPTVVDELLACETPELMENKALKLRIEKGAVDAKPIDKTDTPEGGGKVDTGGMSLEERLGKSMEGDL